MRVGAVVQRPLLGSGGDEEELLHEPAGRRAGPSAKPCLLVAAFAALLLFSSRYVVAAFGSSRRRVAAADRAAARRYPWTSELRENGKVWHAYFHGPGGHGTLSVTDAVTCLANGSLGPALGAALRASKHAHGVGAFFWETPPTTLLDAPTSTFEMVTVPGGAARGRVRLRLPCSRACRRAGYPSRRRTATARAGCSRGCAPTRSSRCATARGRTSRRPSAPSRASAPSASR